MLPQEVLQLIGKTGETVIMDVEKGAIKKFADAVGETNPLYWDEDYAKNTEYGGIIAPPGFFGWPVKWKGPMPMASELRQEAVAIIAQAGYPRVLDGGIEYEFFSPIPADDTLTAKSVIADIQEREGKTGKMILTILKTTYVNQDGNLVAEERKITIQR
jgi:acyl dehydratase